MIITTRSRSVVRLWRVYFSGENPVAEDGYGFFDRTKRARSVNRGPEILGRFRRKRWGFHGGEEERIGYGGFGRMRSEYLMMGLV